MSPGVSVLVAAAGIQLLYSFRPLWFLNQQILTVDDTYYFLQVARNIVRLGWSTFDGLHATNGVQLLWTAILSALAWIFDERLALIRATLVVCALLNLTAGLLLRRLATLLHSRAVGETTAVLWSLLTLWSGTSLTGMEYSLQTATISGLVLCWWRVMTDAQIRPGLAVTVGLVAALSFWARLDSALFSLVVLLSASIRVRLVQTSSWRVDLLRLWLPSVAGAWGYALLSQAMGGTFIPISGLVKGIYAAEHFTGYSAWVSLAGHAAWWCRIVLQPAVDVAAAVFAQRVGPVSLSYPLLALVGVAAASITTWGVKTLWNEDADHMRGALGFTGILGILAAAHAAAMVVQTGHFSHTTKHYYGWLSMSWCLWAAVLLVTLTRKYVRLSQRRVLVGVFGIVVALQISGISRVLRAPVDELELRNVRTDLIQWIDSNLPPGQPIASWNAGQFGYFLDRPVVNLDGLVNDRNFLDFLRTSEPISFYLNQQGIRYVVDYNDPDLSMPYLADWNRDELFRNEIPWSDVDRLQDRRATDRTLYVLRLK